MKGMNIKIQFLLFFLVLSAFSKVSAQKTENYKQTIRGSVVDEDTKSPLIGANIVIINSDPFLGAATDIDGKFKIENVPVGRHNIQVSYLGYESNTLTNQLVSSGKQLVLDIELSESVTKIQEVVITASGDNKAAALNDMAIVSARSFSVEETNRFAAGASDPARMITAYAGAAGNGGDDQNAIVIRGNSPRGLLWRLEGIEIPNPNHFASEGASSGGISVLSANTLAKSDFYTGAFPAEFGNALSGAFDIKLRSGNNEKREYIFQAGILGIEAALEGPFKKGNNSSYLVNYRYSTLGLFSKMGIHIVSEDDETTYQDAAFKFNFPTKKAGNFSFYGIGGLSQDDYKSSGDTYTENIKTNMGVVGMSHLISINKKSFLKTGISLSATKIIDDAQDPPANYQYIEDKGKSYLRISTKLRTKFNAQHILESGLVYARLAYHFTEREIDSEQNPPFDNYEYLNEKGKSGSLQGYTSWKYKITDKLTLINGLHLLFFELNKKVNIEPRLALKWQFKPKQSIALGLGMHSRIESLEYYLAKYKDSNGKESQPNTGLDFTKAIHCVLSYDYQFNKNWYLKVETYFQQLYNVPIINDTSSIFSTLLLEDDYIEEPLINKGTGTNYGLELTVQRFFNKDFYLLFNGSIYSATYKTLDGKKRNTPFGSNFGLNLLSGKEFAVGKSKQNIIAVNLRGAWGGNKRYIPVDLEASRTNGFEVLDYENAYEKRLADYWKIDLQLSYRLNLKKCTQELRFELLNVTNHQNIYAQYYNSNTGNIEFDTQTGIIPAFGYRIEF